ncbi:jg16165 [Pararge aegeria aegeria]|uniref:Jg16165 protein n=1 Tax=Pararge aegeria aegeria TaxID=348720 RepID=A0A8S4RE93_9NEOP|nr:jg16165 [Pararge aegeria aegeria]
MLALGLDAYVYANWKILTKVKPVGGNLGNRFVPLTEVPPPRVPHYRSGRRHLEDECSQRPPPREVFEGSKVDIQGDYYDERVRKTVATVIIPDHIDFKHFQVTTQVPYLTLGPIEAIGYHPSTLKSEHPSECEKIYQDHIEDLYSDETTDYSEESLEMAKMPMDPVDEVRKEIQDHLEDMYYMDK